MSHRWSPLTRDAATLDGRRGRRPRPTWLAAPLLIGTVAACGGGADDQFSFSPAGERGRDLSTTVGCAGCHGGPSGDAPLGPAWVGSWGQTIELEDGSSVVFDDAYVVSSVREPAAQRRVDAKAVSMPAFTTDQLSDQDLQDLIVYLRELGTPS